MKRGSLILLIVMTLFLVLSACSTTAPNPSVNPTPIGACVLVPDMDAIVGKSTVGPPGGYTLNDVDRCTWTYELDPSRYVTLSIALKQAHSEAIAALGAGEIVPGLGDDARWWAANHLLSVSTGPSSVQVDLQLNESDVSKDLAVRIAQAALQNLN